MTVALIINQKWCKGCGICVASCPEEALFINAAGKAEKYSDKRAARGVCEFYCPDYTLVVDRKGTSANGGS